MTVLHDKPEEAALPVLLNARQVAALLGISVHHAYHLRERGQGPPSVRLRGLGVRWPRSGIEAYIAAAEKAAR